jgi:hypothetical protein
MIRDILFQAQGVEIDYLDKEVLGQRYLGVIPPEVSVGNQYIFRSRLDVRSTAYGDHGCRSVGSPQRSARSNSPSLCASVLTVSADPGTRKPLQKFGPSSAVLGSRSSESNACSDPAHDPPMLRQKIFDRESCYNFATLSVVFCPEVDLAFGDRQKSVLGQRGTNVPRSVCQKVLLGCANGYIEIPFSCFTDPDVQVVVSADIYDEREEVIVVLGSIEACARLVPF